MDTHRVVAAWRASLIAVAVACAETSDVSAQAVAAKPDQAYEHQQTRDLVALVKDAAERVRTRGEGAFREFRVSGSRWRQGETYVFVLDPAGKMLVHPDSAMEGRDVLELKDVDGRLIIRGLIGAVASSPGKEEGWYHYQWSVPGGLLPRWKSSYVRLVTTPSGARYLVGSGLYNDRMERAFVMDMVGDAVAWIEREGPAAFARFRDPKGPFIAKEAYIFVIDGKGVDLVNPGFPNLEGRNVWDLKDARGNKPIQEMAALTQARGAGWVDYMWPKPGESVATQKSAYVTRVKMGGQWVVVGCGVYLADAPRSVPPAGKMKAREVVALVGEGAALLEKQGEKAYAEFRQAGSRWFHDDTYIFVWSMDGTRVFHAANPASEGENVSGMKDVLGRSVGRMMLEAAGSAGGDGWVHYMYPEPGDIFPTWKSTYVKRVTFPSGKQHLIGCGIYNMQMDRAFVEDMVNRAAGLIEAQGQAAFGQLRDKTGPFVFMDSYIFVDTIDGTEVVNPAQPSLEGVNLMGLRDAKGKAVAKEYIEAAMTHGSAWVDYYWYRPGESTPSPKHSFVRKAQARDGTYIVGSGVYLEQ